MIIAALVLANRLIPMPYLIEAPGSAVGVSDLIDVPADKKQSANGDFLLTTVSQREAHPFEWLWAKVSPNTELVKKQDVVGNISRDEYLHLNEEAMQDSQYAATAVALRRAGYSVSQLGDGAKVLKVVENSPSVGKLLDGDTITAVNGTSVVIAGDVTRVAQGLKPGDVVTFHVKNAQNVERDVEITAAVRSDGQPGAQVGVYLQTVNPRLDKPFPVTFKETGIGGPSAGLAFTLSLLDDITAGDLTGGGDVAVTGTMGIDGSVGPIGGIKQKVATVAKGDTKLMLVPKDNYDEAAKDAPKDLQLVAVTSLDDAIAALGAHGGDISGVPVQTPEQLAA